MPVDVVTRTFREWAELDGFRRKGTTFYREQRETLVVVNLQGSQWGGQKYVNVAWWLLVLGEPNDPPHNRCHIRARLDSLVPDPTALTQILQEDGSLTEIDRALRLREMLDSYLVPHLAATETLSQIKRNEGGWLDRVGVRASAREALARA
jgi:hypothetical protein